MQQGGYISPDKSFTSDSHPYLPGYSSRNEESISVYVE